MDADSPYMLLVAGVKFNRRRQHDRERAIAVWYRQAQRAAFRDAGGNARRLFRAHSNRPCRTPIRVFHRLLTRFKELTGCPVLVNTSFNVRGEPIVCTPEGRIPLFHGQRARSVGRRELCAQEN